MSAKPPTQPSEPAAESGSAEALELSVAQAAQLVGVSEQALRKRIRKGTLEANKVRRGNQIVTVIARAELEAAYPEVVGVEAAPAPEAERAQPVAKPRRSEELVVRLREDLATAVAARQAAEGRYEAAESRARQAEEKLERALVQRGDDLARTRKETERQTMQMAMEIARAQIQARLPESVDGVPSVRSRGGSRWLAGGAVLASLLLACWGWIAWGRLDEARASGQELAGQVATLEGRAASAFERAADAELAAREAEREIAEAQSEADAERRRHARVLAELRADLQAARDASAQDRARLLERLAVEVARWRSRRALEWVLAARRW